MLKIYEKIWFVKTTRSGSDDLSYMTYYEDNAAFKKRKFTGLRWAGLHNNKTDDYGEIIPNEPASGFEIVSSVSRWTTQNKLFRVRDPRGFVVEIPAGNLAKIIACSTISKSVIMDECVWGREGQDHLLIPKNSDLFEEASVNMQKLDTNIKIKDVAVGEIIEANAWGRMQKLIYLGKFKATHSGEYIERGNTWSYSMSSSRKVIADLGEHTDTKWWHAFGRESDLARISDSNSYCSIDQRRTITVTSRTGQKVDMDIVEQMRDKVKYGDTTEARNKFYKLVKDKNYGRGTIDTALKGTTWQ